MGCSLCENAEGFRLPWQKSVPPEEGLIFEDEVDFEEELAELEGDDLPIPYYQSKLEAMMYYEIWGDNKKA